MSRRAGFSKGACPHALHASTRAAAEALRLDYSIMPHDTCEALGLTRGASYADAAAAVLENRQTWSEHSG
jgi:hypothetical protein